MNNNIASFKNHAALMEYAAKVNNRFTKGEVVFCEEENTYYVFDEEWKATPVEMLESGLGINLYELNKSAIAAMPIMDYAQLTEKRDKINAFFSSEENYHMLLCKEISYYTIFNKLHFEKEFITLGDAVVTCLKESFGNIVAIDEASQENGHAFEIWVKTYENDVYCMYLFCCDKLIVGYGD